MEDMQGQQHQPLPVALPSYNSPSKYGAASGGGAAASSDVCFKCGQSGHWSKDCPSEFPVTCSKSAICICMLLLLAHCLHVSAFLCSAMVWCMQHFCTQSAYLYAGSNSHSYASVQHRLSCSCTLDTANAHKLCCQASPRLCIRRVRPCDVLQLSHICHTQFCNIHSNAACRWGWRCRCRWKWKWQRSLLQMWSGGALG